MRPAVFIERDGILNKVQVAGIHQVIPLQAADFRPNLEAVRLFQKLKAAGFLLLVTTNQPGLSRGYLCRSELDMMHRLVRATFPVDDIFMCPHDEMDCCPCRKPRPGLLLEASFKWHVDLDRSFVISDKWQDAEAARLAGCTSLLLQSPWIGAVHHDFVVPSLEVAVAKVMQLRQMGQSFHLL